MRECVSFHVGQAGCQIGQDCWKLFSEEHKISSSGIDYSTKEDRDFNSTFFEEVREKYIPRAIFVDTEASVIDEIKKVDVGNFFHPDRFVHTKEDSANNFARGYYSLSRDLTDKLDDIQRRTIEVCDSLQGFYIHHSFGGGTGSGYTPILLSNLADDYPKKTLMTLSVYPSNSKSVAIVEPYNAILGIDKISQLSECSILFDNASLYNVAIENLKIKFPLYTDLNRLIAQVASSVSISTRFPGDLNIDLIEYPTNLVPFSRLKFPVASFSPLATLDVGTHQNLNVTQMTNICCQPKSQFFNNESNERIFMSACFIYRGNVTHCEITDALNELKLRKRLKFCNWLSTGFKVGINSSLPVFPFDNPISHSDKSVCMVSNSTTVAGPFSKTASDFLSMYNQSAFVHWYEGEGMEKGEFEESIGYMVDLIEEYNEIDS